MGIKRQGREAEHSHLVSRVKMREALSPPLMARCLIKQMVKFTLPLFYYDIFHKETWISSAMQVHN
jgi:hypothetical protein